ncbi:protein translocase subunit SecD [Paenibacillus mucilaginosus]|uniref:Protein translocase subunit SecD n=2 Tax=Paenibacillus mucilaginosus TaxID=61624 RepID=I0BRK4_9BACL|nr:protein translocase subunit SecD [Paenibacillus mucilaginosus]AEI44928.1 SecDF [Paenibacillus mucilaginosus KNP414]AFH65001.1 preprotein translocase subunit SecD [Paenibacillus mucilaginosus K02]MCG7214968.1 protein translocase subunit SecD [Paenibacillus mucilaginosus]WDM26441.1 protein translocase subunit SecD [Paenibacillus mucilaginosus]WFA21141.1 protein translocase subunit SecD [Paenibacillus mucilaginosus]
MDIKRFAAFLGIVAIVFVSIGLTSPSIVRDVRLGLDLKGGFEILYVAEPIEAGKPVTAESLKQTAHSLEKRADSLGVAEPEVTTEGTDRIRVKLAGVENEEQVRKLMKEPAELTFRGPDGTKEMLGSDFVEGAAQIGYDEQNRPLIQIEVKDKEKFRKVTEKLLHQPLAIYLDEKELSAPIVQQVLTDGKATISGNYTFEEAKTLADTINLGALPLKLTEKYTQSVGATLGQLSLQETVRAGLIGSVLILLFMVIFYRIPGVVAAITIITYAWLLLVVFNWMNATLTLPGIAAFILGIGMAVDANIITYERIKEEIRSGKSILSSLKAGSKHSFRTIMDANITNIIASAVLFYIGNGAIRGFALTTMLSIVISILTNVFFARFLIVLLVRANLFKKPAYFGVKESEIRGL